MDDGSALTTIGSDSDITIKSTQTTQGRAGWQCSGYNGITQHALRLILNNKRFESAASPAFAAALEVEAFLDANHVDWHPMDTQGQ
jgi:hypothetical protein